MVSIEVIALALTGLGLTASIVYYANVLNNANKTRELQIKAQKQADETRQIQFLIEFNQQKIETMATDFNEIMKAEWTDFDDWYKKYSIVNNPENYAKRDRLWEAYHINGLLIRDGVIDIETYIDYLGDTPILMWDKYEDVIKELRTIVSLPTYMMGFEILAKEIIKYRNSKGWGPKQNALSPLSKSKTS
jgi:hypothetical protein